MKKFKQLKQWLSNTLPTFDEDQQKHFFVTYALAHLPTTVGTFPGMSIVGVSGLAIIAFGAILWEVIDLYDKGLTRSNLNDSLRDLAASFAGLYLAGVSMLIQHTT